MQLSFQRGDIVVSAGFTPACYCILEVAPFRPAYPYSGLNLVNLNRYQLADNGLTRVGTATEEFLKGHTNAPSGSPVQKDPAHELRYRRGQMRAARAAWESTGDEQKRWLILASAKPGDNMNVHGHATPCKFRYVVERGSKYVFVAETAQGDGIKFSLHSLCLVQPAVNLLSNVDLIEQRPT